MIHKDCPSCNEEDAFHANYSSILKEILMNEYCSTCNYELTNDEIAELQHEAKEEYDNSKAMSRLRYHY